MYIKLLIKEIKIYFNKFYILQQLNMKVNLRKKKTVYLNTFGLKIIHQSFLSIIGTTLILFFPKNFKTNFLTF